MTKKQTLIAYHGDPAIKAKYIERVQRHRLADELIRGIGWDGHKGCAVGCTLEKYDHAAYETELGIPRSIARLEDGLFESLPVDLAMAWPERFLAAIAPGADLSLVMSRWFVWMLTDSVDGVIQYARTERSQKSIQRVSDLYQRKIAGGNIEIKEWRAAAAAAYAAAVAYAAADADAAAYAAAAAYVAAAADAAAADAAAADAAVAAYVACAADSATAALRPQLQAIVVRAIMAACAVQ